MCVLYKILEVSPGGFKMIGSSARSFILEAFYFSAILIQQQPTTSMLHSIHLQ